MSIVTQAEYEMKLAGFPPEEIVVMKQIIRLFLSQWDSGGAVSVMQPVLTRLISGQPLSPLTGADNEWIDRTEETGRPFWQNLRASSIFKDENGKCFDIDNPDVGPITFPYDPATKHVSDPIMTVITKD